jgi:hypothetical protein
MAEPSCSPPTSGCVALAYLEAGELLDQVQASAAGDRRDTF